MSGGALVDRRSSGVLLHPTSLPGGAIGDLGSEARRFLDWLADAGQSFWQILPLVAVDEGGSPYNGLSALAGNPLLVSMDDLVREGLLTAREAAYDAGDAVRVDYAEVSRWKADRMAQAYRRLRGGAAPELADALVEYRQRNESWLNDYLLFRSLRGRYRGAPWTEWDEGVRSRDPAALADARRELAEQMDLRAFQQFLFDRQWSAVLEHAHARGIAIIGDIPIFVAHDSSDVWAHQDIFQLDAAGRPEVISGVPPDYFSETGQRWGNPLYRWDVLRERDYDWWVERFRRTLSWVDIVRIDHFRGFEAYWQIPAEEETAINGTWEQGPGAEFFRAVERQLGPLPVIAEDLGLITPEVEALRDELGYPGMRVLQFAFDGDPRNPHLPENYPENSVAYTGTHDNDTVVGWWASATRQERSAVRERLAADPGDGLHWQLMEMVFQSRANLVVVPVQDVLGLDSAARMNTPGTTETNWTWRMRGGEFTNDLASHLRALADRSGRLVHGSEVPTTLPNRENRR